MRAGNLTYLPRSFGRLTQLQDLERSFCGSLVTMSYSIGDLQALRMLHIRHSGQLKCLRNSCTRSKNLEVLDLETCKSLAVLPDNIGELTALQRLRLIACKKL
ncbi:hypothetical protein Mapa_015855 [Marchantia paleacea]|nr:hypothetical protein Mapa_015855 [Marchantia paleacea]